MKLKIRSITSAKYINKKTTRVLKTLALLAFACWLVVVRGLQQASAFAVSLFVHEAFHLACAWLLGLDFSLSASVLGFRMNGVRPKLSIGKSIVLWLSGPFANAILAFNIYFASRSVYIPLSELLIFYNVLLACVNMTPAYPLDASRALEGILAAGRGRLWAVRFVGCISMLVSALLFGFGVYMFVFSRDNIVLPVLAVFMFASARKEITVAENEALHAAASALY
jgi:hypothetical protein